MYYRVKQFKVTYKSMFVIDKDSSLADLKSRTTIEDCAQEGYRSFDNPNFLESQEIKCVSQGGKTRSSDIIEE